MNKKSEIKDYWETRLPQRWYSKKTFGTKEYFEETEFVRYNRHYTYLPEVAEFREHPNEKVLEVGCGMGTDLIQYAKAGSICTGIDLTKNAINITKKRFKLYNLKADLRVVDAESLPFRDNTFDLVFSFGVLHHTPNTKKAIDEIYRVLKPGGKAIVMLYAKGTAYYGTLFYFGVLNGELFNMSKEEVINKHSEQYGNSPLTRIYSRREVEELFKIFDFVKINRYSDAFAGPHIKFITSRIGNIMGGHFVIKATKAKNIC